MKCDYDNTRIMQWINNEMTGSEKEIFENHLVQCAECTRQLKAFQYIWNTMGQIPSPEPSEEMLPNFQSMLETFRKPAISKNALARLLDSVKGAWVLQPRLRLVYGFLLLMIGAFSGYLLSRTNSGNNYKLEMDSLSSQVREMREMMTISLLENPSASERMRGVGYTNEIKGANKQVIDALVSTLNNDPNVNVRLMTLDALAHFADNAGVREALVQSIVQQRSPLVQSAMADVMLKLQEKRAIQPFKKLLEQKQLNEMVKNKIEETINRLI